MDQLHDAHHHTGPLTLIRVERREAGQRPLGALRRRPTPTSPRSNGTSTRTPSATGSSSRKSTTISGSLSATAGPACDEFGWVRTATLENRSAAPVADRPAGRPAERPALRRSPVPLPAGEQPRRRLQEDGGGSRDRARHLLAHRRHHRPGGGPGGAAGQHGLVLRSGGFRVHLSARGRRRLPARAASCRRRRF